MEKEVVVYGLLAVVLIAVFVIPYFGLDSLLGKILLWTISLILVLVIISLAIKYFKKK